MRKKNLLVKVAVVLFVSGLCLSAEARASGGSLRSLAREAVSEEASVRAAAVASLRAAGPVGLDALFEEYAAEIGRARAEGEPAGTGNAAWRRIAEALDAVSQQRDDFASGLYWYTDAEEARRAARASGKPLLSLRLLGRLSDEYSCANSRFFRTALYANAEVSKQLRENFVLHWQSVRPAPVVTVDYGDGRKLVRTITGNSIHYVLDSEGRPVDALPGLYGPQAFLFGLNRALGFTRMFGQLEGVARAQALASYYNSQAAWLIQSVQVEAAQAGVKVPAGTFVTKTLKPGEPNEALPPTALRAAPLAMTKMSVEIQTVRSITYSPTILDRATVGEDWMKIAALHVERSRLDPSSIRLVRRDGPYVGAGAEVTPERLARVVSNFERRMALDTVRNEYLMRPTLLRWLWETAAAPDLEALNRRVYADLFLTPDTDPWLGLLSPDTYTAIKGDGVVAGSK